MAIGVVTNKIDSLRELFQKAVKGQILRPVPFFITIDGQYSNIPVIVPILHPIENYKIPNTKGSYVYPENGLTDNSNPYLNKINYEPLVFRTMYDGSFEYIREIFKFESSILVFYSLFGLIRNRISQKLSSFFDSEYYMDYEVQEILSKIEILTGINPLSDLFARGLSNVDFIKIKHNIKKKKPIVYFFKSLTEMYSGYLDADTEVVISKNSMKKINVTFTMNIFRKPIGKEINDFIIKYKTFLRDLSLL